MRFQADADLNEDMVKGVRRREPEIDFQTATAAGLRGLSDLEVLKLAARENRVLVTHDRKTMPRAFAEFVQNNSSAGLVVVSQKIDLLITIEEVLLIWAASEAEEGVTQCPSCMELQNCTPRNMPLLSDLNESILCERVAQASLGRLTAD